MKKQGGPVLGWGWTQHCLFISAWFLSFFPERDHRWSVGSVAQKWDEGAL